ncbi:hypothetical protein TNCV_763661 [Trichonephila clavipes]|nr:hypothetical protein TNCV_763661 [Trichonephila clavipes]
MVGDLVIVAAIKSDPHVKLGPETPLVHIDGYLTAKRCVTKVVEPVILPLFQGTLYTAFQQDNTKLHILQSTLNSLIGFNILPWPANSLDLNPFELL